MKFIPIGLVIFLYCGSLSLAQDDSLAGSFLSGKSFTRGSMNGAIKRKTKCNKKWSE